MDSDGSFIEVLCHNQCVTATAMQPADARGAVPQGRGSAQNWLTLPPQCCQMVRRASKQRPLPFSSKLDFLPAVLLSSIFDPVVP
jgi:hypothetical protein